MGSGRASNSSSRPGLAWLPTGQLSDLKSLQREPLDLERVGYERPNLRFLANNKERGTDCARVDLCRRLGASIPYRVMEAPIVANQSLKNELTRQVQEVCQLIQASVEGDAKARCRGDRRLLDQLDTETPPPLLAIDFAYTKDDPALKVIEFQAAMGTQGLATELDQTYRNLFETELVGYQSITNDGEWISHLKKALFRGNELSDTYITDVDIFNQPNVLDIEIMASSLNAEMISFDCLLDKIVNYDLENRTMAISRLMIDELSDQQIQYYIDHIRNKRLLAPHIGWQLLVSKWMMTEFSRPYIPETYYSDMYENDKSNLNDFVIKPIFGRGGKDVIIFPNLNDIDFATRDHGLIFQRRVNYSAIRSPIHTDIKVEIRALCTWSNWSDQPFITHALVRGTTGHQMALSKNLTSDYTGVGLLYFQNQDENAETVKC